MIKSIKFFVLLILVSSFVVWLTNNPGIITVYWNNYVIKTNAFGFVSLFLIFVVAIIFVLSLSRKIKNIPRELKIAKQKKNLILANETLDNLAYNLFLGNTEDLQKDTRKIKKYLNNNFFSNFLLFQSSLVQNNLDESKKYLKILETNQKYRYSTKRAQIIVLLRGNEVEIAKNLLIDFCKEYPKDNWFHEKLSMIYSQEKNWIKAHDTLDKVKKLISIENKRKLANLKVLTKKNVVEALVMSKSSVVVIKENIKHYIENSNVKKASQLLIKEWPNFLCFELMEVFVTYKSKDTKEKLSRYKLIRKSFKTFVDLGGNETKYALAFACFQASLWGESLNFLEQISDPEWDNRSENLYKKISERSEKIEFKNRVTRLQNNPKWTCDVCNSTCESWVFICANCKSIDTIRWPKETNKSGRKFDFYYEFLKDSFRQLPKMKR